MYENYHEKYKEECFLRNRSAGTTEQYWSAIKTFMKWCDYKPMEELTIQDARNYIISKRRNGSKSETCNFCNSAIAFLFRHVLRKGWDEELVPRMKVDHELPTVYSLEEIQHLIDTAKTIRNKAIIALLYSSGLRVGELCTTKRFCENQTSIICNIPLVQLEDLATPNDQNSIIHNISNQSKHILYRFVVYIPVIN